MGRTSKGRKRRSARAAPRKTAKRAPSGRTRARALPSGAELDRIGRALAAEPSLERALDLLLAEARRLTRAEAGTVYLRDGGYLRFAAVQNDVLAKRLGEAEVKRLLSAVPLTLTEPSVATYVALTRAVINLRDAYQIPVDRPFTLYQEIDKRVDYQTRSMLGVPLRDGRGNVFGVLQLINALDPRRRGVVPFDETAQARVAVLVAHVASLDLPAKRGL